MIIRTLKNWLKVLINLYNKIIRGIIIYPRAILPRKNFVQKINFDNHLSNFKFWVVRRTEKKPSEAFDGITLRVDALISELKDVPEMSMNLLGGLFKIKHLKYITKGQANDKWINSEVVRLKDYRESFEIKNEVYPIYFILNDIHNQEVPYNRRPDQQIKKLYKNLNIPLPIADFVISTGISIVSHKPINLNYWHVEFLLSDIKTEQDVKRKNIKTQDNEFWQNNLARNALNDILSVNAKKEIAKTNYNKMPNSFYSV